MKNNITKVATPQDAGFTLVELMIVIAIIGILASVAIPQYAQYTRKAKFSEVKIYTAERKTAVTMCAQETNSLATCSGDGQAGNFSGIPADATNLGKYITSITTLNGDISVETNGEVNNLTYTLDATLQQSAVTWETGGTCIAVGFC